MNDIILIGAGGFALDVLWLIERINTQLPTWNVIGFADDTFAQGTIVNGLPVLGNIEWLFEQKGIYAFCAIGSAKGRKSVVERLSGCVRFATLIDPSVMYCKSIPIGEGSVLCAGTIIATRSVYIGTHVLVDLDCKIEHGTVLRDFCTLYPSVNVSGNVTLCSCVELGASSVVLPNLSIGENTIVGAGAIVTKNLPQNCTAVGVPARPIRLSHRPP